MQKKNIIRFVESFILLPVVTMSMPMGSISNPSLNITSAPYSVLSQKQNIEANGLIAFNQAQDQKAKTLEKQAQAIDAYFKGHNMPLEGMGQKMAEEAMNNGIDWRLLPAISVMETSGGENLCKNPKAPHNPFGWGSCKIGFENFEKAIEVVAWNLGGKNPNTDQHYAGKTVKEILEKYNPPKIRPDYVKKVMKVMNDIGPEDLNITTVNL